MIYLIFLWSRVENTGKKNVFMPLKMIAWPCVWGAIARYLEQSQIAELPPRFLHREDQTSPLERSSRRFLARLTSFSVFCLWRVIQGSLEKQALWWVLTYLMVLHHWSWFGTVQRDGWWTEKFQHVTLSCCWGFFLLFFLSLIREAKWVERNCQVVFFLFFLYQNNSLQNGG